MVDRVLTSPVSRRTVVKASLLAPAVAVLPSVLTEAAAQDSLVATMVTDTAGLGDQNFNDLANKGGQQAATDLGIEWKVIESADASAYVPNLIAGAEQGQLTVAVGYLLTDAITEVANQYADKNFLIIDSASDAPNVQGVLYKENEAAFLTGVAAGLSTKANKIGFVGGQRIPPVVRYEVGFLSGVKTVNPDAEVSIVYADTFSDPPQGLKIASEQFNLGADIVFPAAGGTGIGCYSAAAEKGEGYWVIGADVSQEHLAPGRELCVCRKGVDFGVYQGVKSVVDGTFKGGVNTLGLKEGGVALEDPNNRLTAEVIAIADAFKQLIVDGSLVVPSDDDTYKAFVPPAVPEVQATPSA